MNRQLPLFTATRKKVVAQVAAASKDAKPCHRFVLNGYHRYQRTTGQRHDDA
ncbi:hypothetical protein [Burkholderia pseudomallei]|uniref:hypothetical protein n=1 Tax=Burkholderia pseudomallei TaxID=28450 RepID=UPI001606AAA7|nr:hypothetical protein [Burkholderia pseudomallei]